jgi:hypothetical protein
MRERGWAAEVESGEARADVALERYGHRVAVEVCLSTERTEAGKVEGLKAQGFHEVWVVCADARTLEAAERQGQGARFMLFAELARGQAGGGRRDRGKAKTSTATTDIDIRGVEQDGKTQDPRKKADDSAGVGSRNADPAWREKEGKKQSERRSGEKQRRNGNGNDIELRVGQLLRSINDVDVLEGSPLARHKVVAALADSEFRGRAHPRGRSLQKLIRLAAKRAAEDASGPNTQRLRVFVERYAAGHAVAAIAREIGLSREQVTRSYRPKAVQLIAARLATLFREIEGRLSAAE